MAYEEDINATEINRLKQLAEGYKGVIPVKSFLIAHSMANGYDYQEAVANASKVLGDQQTTAKPVVGNKLGKAHNPVVTFNTILNSVRRGN